MDGLNIAHGSVHVIENYLEHIHYLMTAFPVAYTTLMVLGLVVFSLLVNWVMRRVLLSLLNKLLARWPLWGTYAPNVPSEMPLIRCLAHFVPIFFFVQGLDLIPQLPKKLVIFLYAGCKVYVIAMVALTVSHALHLINTLYERRADSRDRPIKGFLQVIKIITFASVGLSIIATFFGVALTHIVTGLGAITAVLILVFQDTLLSLVASLQISSDRRIRMGDWIEMPAFDVNGTVVDIALHSIQVRNWDLTTVSIPTKRFLTDSFKNWRGVFQSSCRQIRRSIYLDHQTIRILKPCEIDALKELPFYDELLNDIQELEAIWKQQSDLLESEIRILSEPVNIQLLRFYIQHFLKHHPGVRQNLRILARQLQPTSQGLPFEVWCFTTNPEQMYYEMVQNEIFSHLFAVLPKFHLRVYQLASDVCLSHQMKANDGRMLAPDKKIES